MAGWTPMFQKMVHSSIWDEPDHIRLAWVSILLTTEKDGLCPVKTAKGLSNLARLTEEQSAEAIKVLSGPDEKTFNQEFEGRRIEITPEGILVLNWQKYREKAQSEATRKSNQMARAKYRENNPPKPKSSLRPDYEPPEDPVDEEPSLSPENQRILENLNRRPLR